MWRLLKSIAVFLTTLLAMPQLALASGETVNVKHRGPVPLETFECVSTPESSFINRICYDATESYMLVQIRQTYYHYCEVDAETVSAFVGAPSAGKFYNRYIKGTGSDGPFDCRTRRVPEYL
jgi:hypothetical protein